MFMSPKELAAVLGVTPQCITAWCRAGYMHGDAHMVNGRWVIRWSDLLRTSLPVIGNKLRTNGKVEAIVGKRPRGRPRGSPNKQPSPHKALQGRNSQILNARQSGQALSEIADKYGIKRQRVHQILKSIQSD